MAIEYEIDYSQIRNDKIKAVGHSWSAALL